MVDKVKGWLMITGVAVLALFGIIIFFKPMMTLMFGVGDSSQAANRSRICTMPFSSARFFLLILSGF